MLDGRSLVVVLQRLYVKQPSGMNDSNLFLTTSTANAVWPGDNGSYNTSCCTPFTEASIDSINQDAGSRGALSDEPKTSNLLTPIAALK